MNEDGRQGGNEDPRSTLSEIEGRNSRIVHSYGRIDHITTVKTKKGGQRQAKT